MKRNPSRTLSATLALFLGLALVTPGTGYAERGPSVNALVEPSAEAEADTPARVEIPSGPRQYGTVLQLPGTPQTRTLQTLAAGGLDLTVTEACGTVADDRVGYANEPCSVTVTVTDAVTSSAVTGATVQVGTATATTNEQGVVSVNLPSLPWGITTIEAFADTQASPTTRIIGIDRGTGLLDPIIYDQDGNPLHTYQLQVIREIAPGVTDPWFFAIEEGEIPGPIAAGNYLVQISANGAPGEGYVMDFDQVTVAEGTTTPLVADGSRTRQVTATASLQGVPLSGAEVWLTSTHANSYAHPFGVTSLVNGQAVIRAFPGSYDLAIMGQSPAFFGLVHTELADTPVTVDMSVTKPATLNFALQSVAALDSGKTGVAFATDSHKEYHFPGTAASILVAPGSYQVRAWAGVTDEAYTWDYYFYGLPGPEAEAFEPYPFVPGQIYNLTGAGPWDVDLDAPDHLSIGSDAFFDVAIRGRDLELAGVWRRPNGGTTFESMTTTAIWQPDGEQAASHSYLILPWTATGSSGTYTFAADIAPGPFFPPGTDLSDSVDFYVGTILAMSMDSQEAMRGKLLPGGSFDLNLEAYDFPAEIQSMTLEIRYDPAAVSYLPEKSWAGDGTIAVESGAITWTWNQESAFWIDYPDLVFAAVPGFYGETELTTGPASSYTYLNGEVTESTILPQSVLTVPVARNAIVISAEASGYPIAALVTDGVNSKWATASGGMRVAAVPTDGRLMVLDVPAEMNTLLVMSPMHLTAEIPIAPPTTGRAVVDVPLTYGDLNNDGTVDQQDLDQLKAVITPPGRYALGPTSVFDIYDDDKVDIVDAGRVTEGFGTTAPSSTPRGTLQVTVDTNELPTAEGEAMVLLRQAGMESMAVPAATYLALTRGQAAVATFEVLPPGLYHVSVRRGDEVEWYQFNVEVKAGQSTVLTVDW